MLMNIKKKRNEDIMYSIGEYSKIAQVSKRLLRYYDEIGLFQPIKVEPTSGHRYYSASQLPALNRILALKELGLSKRANSAIAQRRYLPRRNSGYVVDEKSRFRTTGIG